MANVYEIITEKIIAALDKGVVPWHKPWSGGRAMNLVSKKEYRGINSLLLNDSSYKSPYWVSFKQANQLGGRVKKGEHGTTVCYYTMINSKTEVDKNGNPKKFPLLRYYMVFNTDQCEGLEERIPKNEKEAREPIAICEEIVENMPNPPSITHVAGDRASYNIREDAINLPTMEQFDTLPEYYSTLFHEMAHSTGHETRLNRDLKNRFGSEKYSAEELVAEISAAFLCGEAKIEDKTLDNSAAYIAGWRKKLSEDPKIIIKAASAAQKAADYILGKTGTAVETGSAE